MSFKPSNRNNPCPVCGNNKGDCRYRSEDADFIQCHTYVDARKLEKVNGYICVKQSDGHTASFKPDNSEEWTEENRKEWEQRKAARQKQVEKEDRRKQARSLSADKRHELYSQVLEQLTFSQDTINDLTKRGFSSQEIAACEFKSVTQWQQLREPVDKSLPGIGWDGKSLANTGDGYLCPLYDTQGRVIALQLRLHEPKDDNRYRWLSTKAQVLSLYPEGATRGEAPLTMVRPEGKPEGIILAEGCGAKVFLAARRLNSLVIGSPGGLWTSSPTLLKEYLEAGYQETGSRVVSIAVDAGDVQNAHVMQRWGKLADLLHNWGWQVRFMWWGQSSKDDCDIDELEDHSQVRYLSAEEFFAIGQEYADPQKEEQKASENDTYESTPRFWGNWRNSRKYTPDITANQKEFQFPGNLPESNAIIAVKSGLGTGKTEALLGEIEKSNQRGVGTFIPGYRNNLLLQQIQRGIGKGVSIYHLNYDDDSRIMLLDKEGNICACIDSLEKVEAYVKGRNIFLDESCSVLAHAANGGTLGDSQAKILRIFKYTIQVANLVYLLDGNLRDMDVDFISQLDGRNKQVVKIENTKKIPAHDIIFIDAINDENEIKKGDRSPLIQFLFNSEVIPWIMCDSKEKTKVMYELLTSRGKKGFILNSETAGEPWAKELLENPDSWIQGNKPQFFIGSPTVESGFSCTLNDYFTHKFTFLSGVQGTNSQHQIMFRLRDSSIPHYVFCPEHSLIRDSSKPRSYSLETIANILSQKTLQSFSIAGQSADISLQEMLKIAAEAIGRQDEDWLNYSNKLDSIHNFEQDNMRRCLIHVLEEAGHNVRIEEWQTVEPIKDLEAAAKEKVQREHSKELFDSVPFDSIEEANKKAKYSPNKATQRRIELTRLLERLPGIKYSPLWSENFIFACHIKNKHFIKQQERFWLLSNYDTSQKRHESIWNHAALSEDFFSRTVSRMGHDVIWALKELDILKFTQRTSEYCKDSPEVIALIDKLRSRHDIQLALHIDRLQPETGEGKERIEVLNGLLNFIGFKNHFLERRRVRTEKGTVQTRFYAVVPVGTPGKETEEQAEQPFDLLKAREAILEAVEQRFTTWMQSDKSKISWVVQEDLTSSDNESNMVKPSGKISAADLGMSEEQEVEANAELLRLCLTEGDYGMISALTEEWEQSFKSQVWRSLNAEEQQGIRQLAKV